MLPLEVPREEEALGRVLDAAGMREVAARKADEELGAENPPLEPLCEPPLPPVTAEAVEDTVALPSPLEDPLPPCELLLPPARPEEIGGTLLPEFWADAFCPPSRLRPPRLARS